VIGKKLNVDKHYLTGFILIVIVLSTRFISEGLTNFLWRPSNVLWSLGTLMLIPWLFWPVFVLNFQKKQNLFSRFAPIFIYLVYFLARVDLTSLYSYKCYLAEVIVWFFFIFGWVYLSKDEAIRLKIRNLIVLFIKITILIGIAQFIYAVVKFKTIDPVTLLELRPVKGVFAHQSIFLVVTLPFLFYFIKQKAYGWTIALLFTSLLSGTRGPFLALACMSIIVFKSITNRKIKTSDVVIALGTVVIVYIILIANNIQIFSQEFYEGGRFSLSTFQWRINFWSNYIKYESFSDFVLGRGIGAADGYGALLTGRSIYLPHNDYIRIFYDTGIIGLGLFLGLLIYFLRWIMRVMTTENDFILLMFLSLVCFFISDNYAYFTHSIFVYLFLASYLADKDKGDIVNNENTTNK
jgi:O-antigen ligase